VTEAAALAIEAGDRYLVALGGDETVHAIVNALFDEGGSPIAPELVLGVIPAPGFTSDLTDTFGLPNELGPATGHLLGDNFYELDLVKATVATGGGEETTSRYFAIVAEAGLGASRVVWRRRYPSFLGRGRTFLGFWSAYIGARMRDIEVSSGKRKTFEGAAYNVVVGNCQFFGDGIRVSPRSYPGDGVLDVLIMKGPKSDAYTTLPKQYRGEHVPSDHIEEMSGQIVTIESKGKALPVHVDGEPIGITPATFEIIPKAVRLKV
jgi:diacylglycerol kinase family enzyme